MILIFKWQLLYENSEFYWFDLDIDPMALVLELDLDIMKMYVCTKDEAPISNGSKVIAWSDTQTDRQTHRLDWNYYLPTFTDGN